MIRPSPDPSVSNILKVHLSLSLGFEQEVMFVARTNCWNISWKVIKNFFTAQSTLKVMIPVLSLSNSLKIWLMKTFALKHKSLFLILLNQNFWPLTCVSAWHTCHKCSPSSADQEDTQRQSRYTSTGLYQSSWYGWTLTWTTPGSPSRRTWCCASGTRCPLGSAAAPGCSCSAWTSASFLTTHSLL